MGVTVDDITFPLAPSKDAAILFVGEAPVAQTSYHYVKLNGANIVESEPFQRVKVDVSTPNEFYNRTWNSRQITPLPQVFDPLSAIGRSDSKLHVDGHIPTIYFSGNASGISSMHSNADDDIQVAVDMMYISLDEVHTFSNVEIEIAGRSSRWQPKVSYNFKLAKKSDFYGYRSFKLRALATDPSYLREQTSFDIIKATGVPSTGSSFARVFINDRAYGLFGLIENYKKPWYNIEFADETAGISYQSVGHSSDLRYYSNESQYAENYKIKADPNKNEGPGDYQKLIDLTKFIAQQPTNSKDTTKEWERRFNMDSVIRNLALEVLLGLGDGYIANADNYYLYEHTREKRFVYIPSDLDLSLGSTPMKLGLMWSGNYTEYPGYWIRPLTSKLTQIPKYKQQLESVLLKVANDLMKSGIASKHVDDLASMIREDVTWDQSLPRATAGVDMTGANAPKDAKHLQPTADFPETWDPTVIQDILARRNTIIPFDTAVNGPTGYSSLTGVKEWLEHQGASIVRFLSPSQAQSPSS